MPESCGGPVGEHASNRYAEKCRLRREEIAALWACSTGRINNRVDEERREVEIEIEIRLDCLWTLRVFVAGDRVRHVKGGGCLESVPRCLKFGGKVGASSARLADNFLNIKTLRGREGSRATSGCELMEWGCS